MVRMSKVSPAQWTEVVIKSSMPAGLEKLQEMAYNIWWSWNFEAKNLFKEMDRDLWLECGKNPIRLLEIIPYKRLQELATDPAFLNKLNHNYEVFRAYLDIPADKQKPSVAYFSMEYGLTDILNIYSGGLGVLAGDYLKEASDINIDMTAVGFLYRNGYFTQELSIDGQQVAVYEPQNFSKLPLAPLNNGNGQQIVLEIDFPGYKVYCNVWKVAVGRVSLLLLDTDHPDNSEYDRQISAQLYGGDWENRLKQEFLLGIGGIKLLKMLGIKKDVYHCNEGHAALINMERLANYISEDNLDFGQALEIVRASSLYTVHTPVPAGHDLFEESLFSKYISGYAAKLGISWDELMDLGRENPGNVGEKFSMSVFACNTCQEVNGVSWLHGQVSKEMFNPIWPGYFPEELHVDYVTNGVHLPTWTASEWQKLYFKHFGMEWIKDQANPKNWEKIYEVSDDEIWETRTLLKQKLIKYVKAKYKENWLKGQGDPSRVVSLLDKINPDALIIGFGRRFATYKRAHLLFTNLERLSKIVNNPSRPVQFVFTGKAHPADGGGKGLIKRIVEISRMPEFEGKIIFLENYDMGLAKRLVSGVDIWLNTPTRPLEASGTSGQKAEMNGVLNFSVLDGWWLEGYTKGAGWAITEKNTYQNPEYQDQLDAVTIYNMLENEIIPLYYAKNSKGYSPEWISYIKNSIAGIAPRFTTRRMINDYLDKFYHKLADRSAFLAENNFAKAKEISDWKELVSSKWDDIYIKESHYSDKLLSSPVLDETYEMQVVLGNVGMMNGIGLELVILNYKTDGTREVNTREFELVNSDNETMTFKLSLKIVRSGTFTWSLRMFPKNPDLPHRQDFSYVKWLK